MISVVSVISVSKLVLLGIGTAALVFGSIEAEAQKPAPEARLDAIFSETSAVYAGMGLTIPTGTYLRSGLVAALGSSRDALSGRLDLVNRFHLDPFRESRWAPYAGGGLSARFDDNRKGRVYLLIFAGVDGPVSRGLTTSFEAGLGGGGRIGVIVRRAAAKRR